MMKTKSSRQNATSKQHPTPVHHMCFHVVFFLLHMFFSQSDNSGSNSLALTRATATLESCHGEGKLQHFQRACVVANLIRLLMHH